MLESACRVFLLHAIIRDEVNNTVAIQTTAYTWCIMCHDWTGGSNWV